MENHISEFGGEMGQNLLKYVRGVYNKDKGKKYAWQKLLKRLSENKTEDYIKARNLDRKDTEYMKKQKRRARKGAKSNSYLEFVKKHMKKNETLKETLQRIKKEGLYKKKEKKPAEKKPAKKTAKKPAKKPAEKKPAEKKPAKKTAMKPAEKKPAEKKPAKKTAKKPVEKTQQTKDMEELLKKTQEGDERFNKMLEEQMEYAKKWGLPMPVNLVPHDEKAAGILGKGFFGGSNKGLWEMLLRNYISNTTPAVRAGLWNLVNDVYKTMFREMDAIRFKSGNKRKTKESDKEYIERLFDKVKGNYQNPGTFDSLIYGVIELPINFLTKTPHPETKEPLVDVVPDEDALLIPYKPIPMEEPSEFMDIPDGALFGQLQDGMHLVKTIRAGNEIVKQGADKMEELLREIELSSL